jgi:hypothetical protein
MTLLASRRTDKYPHTKMQIGVCIVVVVEHKQSVVVLVVANNNMFLPSV